MRKVNWVIIHQSASNVKSHDNIETVRQWHLDRNFSDIGYHYFINKNGEVFKGRDEEKAGAHVKVAGSNKSHNKDSIGICLSGKGDKEHPETHPTIFQKKSLEILLIDICSRYELQKIDILGHSDLEPTECPGFELSTWLSSLNWH